MVSKKVAKHGTAGRDGGAAPTAATPPRSVPEPRYVDIDPWAMLLEGLTEVPEEQPAKRTRPKKK